MRPRLAAPLLVGVGAAFDFHAGLISQAPPWMQRAGLEWAYRMWLEPSRLAPRYARNARFLLSMVARDLIQGIGDHLPGGRSRALTLDRQPGRGY